MFITYFYLNRFYIYEFPFTWNMLIKAIGSSSMARKKLILQILKHKDVIGEAMLAVQWSVAQLYRRAVDDVIPVSPRPSSHCSLQEPVVVFYFVQ